MLGVCIKKQNCEEHDGLIKQVELNHGNGLKGSLPQRYGSFLKQSASNCSTPWKHSTNEEAQISMAVTMIMFSLISFQKTIHLIKMAVSLTISLSRQISKVTFFRSFCFPMWFSTTVWVPCSPRVISLTCCAQSGRLFSVLQLQLWPSKHPSVWDYPLPLRGILH